MRILLPFLLLFFNVFSYDNTYAQIIEGHVLSGDNDVPLEAATVYFDGTTNVTMTNADGNFKIDSKGSKEALVVSFVGYETLRMDNPVLGKRLKIYLKKEVNELEQVIVGKGPFSRRQMLAVFREQFLGNSKAGRSCKIQNEDDIVLSYDQVTNTLSATAVNPLKVKNRYLEYNIDFELVTFEVNYRTQSLAVYDMIKCYFDGYTLYRDYSKDKSADEKRMKAFLGSTAHLMKTISEKSWDAQKFRLFVGKFQTNPTPYFSVIDTLGMKKISVLKNAEVSIPMLDKSGKPVSPPTEVMKKTYFTVLYDGKLQSIVDFKEKEFLVDADGNYFPVSGLVVGGYLGSLKAGDLLPRDYFENIKDIVNK